MTWKVEFDDHASRAFRKLNSSQDQIKRYLRERIATDEDPRRFGKGLSGDKGGLWRYRVGGHRIICKIEEDRRTVRVVKLGHRKLVYH
jgi:mRNA interferase RelE/StbE